MANHPPLSARDLVDMRRRLRNSAVAVAPPSLAEAPNPEPNGQLSEARAHTNGHAPRPSDSAMVRSVEEEIVRSVEAELRGPDEPAAAAAPPVAPAPCAEPEADQLRAENAKLHSVLGDLRQLLEEMSHHDPDLLEQRIAELEGQIAEKDERNLQLQVQLEEIEQQFAAVTVPPRDEDLAALSDDLERERCLLTQERKQLDEDRRQMRDDEEHLMRQMREMEVSMARERAEMARQRTELTRLHGEIRHELDTMHRDGALTARLVQFQRKHQDMMVRHGLAAPEPVAPPVAAPSPSHPTPASPKRDSGVLRRLFGPR